MKRLFFILALSIFALLTKGEDLSVKINVPKTRYILREPIIVSAIIENRSGKTLKLAYGRDGFQRGVAMNRADGGKRECLSPVHVDYVSTYQIKEAEEGWKEEIEEDLTAGCQDEVGEFIIQGYAYSKGPYYNFVYESGGIARREEIKAWQGKSVSEGIHIWIESPTGVDLEAYNYFKGNPLSPQNTAELLQKYPTSTYAGYALLKYGPSGSMRDASRITPEKFDERFNIYGSDEEKTKRRREAKQKYEDFIRKARAFLSLHPDFPKASLLKKEIANALFYTDKPQEAWKEVEDLSKMEGEWAEEAKSVLCSQFEKQFEPAVKN